MIVSLPVLYTLGGDQRVGDLLHRSRLTAHHQHLQAIVMIQMHVQRGEDGPVSFVLHVNQLVA